METARLTQVKKFVAVGTICAYPKFTPVPFKEKDLWAGYPEETNAPYGLAKKMMLVQSQAYRKQYDFNSIYLMPVNLYGPRDNFNPEISHVIPGLIKRVFDGENPLVVWGSGKQTRSFLYVEDLARGLLETIKKYPEADPLNLGTDEEVTIADLAKIIVKFSGKNIKIVFDTTKPDGQPRRNCDTKKAKDKIGFEAEISLEKGLKKTIDWYRKNDQKKY